MGFLQLVQPINLLAHFFGKIFHLFGRKVLCAEGIIDLLIRELAR